MQRELNKQWHDKRKCASTEVLWPVAVLPRWINNHQRWSYIMLIPQHYMESHRGGSWNICSNQFHKVLLMTLYCPHSFVLKSDIAAGAHIKTKHPSAPWPVRNLQVSILYIFTLSPACHTQTPLPGRVELPEICFNLPHDIPQKPWQPHTVWWERVWCVYSPLRVSSAHQPHTVWLTVPTLSGALHIFHELNRVKLAWQQSPLPLWRSWIPKRNQEGIKRIHHSPTHMHTFFLSSTQKQTRGHVQNVAISWEGEHKCNATSNWPSNEGACIRAHPRRM